MSHACALLCYTRATLSPCLRVLLSHRVRLAQTKTRCHRLRVCSPCLREQQRVAASVVSVWHASGGKCRMLARCCATRATFSPCLRVLLSHRVRLAETNTRLHRSLMRLWSAGRRGIQQRYSNGD